MSVVTQSYNDEKIVYSKCLLINHQLKIKHNLAILHATNFELRRRNSLMKIRVTVMVKIWV